MLRASRRGDQGMTDVNDHHWFLAQLKPNAQAIALRNLARQGFSTFLPQQTVTRRQAGRFVEALRPLFPGYLFVHFDPATAPWRKINATSGVSRLVSFDARPRPVPQALIRELRARCDDLGRLQPTPDLQTGTSVEVLSGPFADFVAEVETIAPDQRVWVLLDLMGQHTRVQLGADQVRATG